MSAGASGDSLLGAFRARAAERFEALPWPSPSGQSPVDDAWRRTDLSKLGLDALAASALKRGAASGRAGSEELSARAIDERWLREGVVAASLEEGMAARGEELDGLLREGLADSDRVSAWHYAAITGGMLLSIPRDLDLPEPILVDFERGSSGELAAPHLFIVLAPGSRASVYLRLSGEGRGLGNYGMDVVLGAGASLNLGTLQSFGAEAVDFSRLRIKLGRDASFRGLDARLGGRIVASSVECDLDGTGSEAFLDGAYHCLRGQHLDLRTIQRHKSQRATSRALYKGAVESGGRGIFQGLIEVEKGASGTDAFLSSRNLLLGPAARSDSIPTLRIGNDDVRCSHGSTTGRLSEEELFYLRSRGFSRAEARAMLVGGFFEEVFAKAPAAMGAEAMGIIGGRLERGRVDAA